MRSLKAPSIIFIDFNIVEEIVDIQVIELKMRVKVHNKYSNFSHFNL